MTSRAAPRRAQGPPHCAGDVCKPRIPRPLGWCSRCLAQGHVEQPAVTMNRGSGLCCACNAAVSAGSPSSALLGDVASEAQALLEVGLDGVRGIARTLGSRPPR